MAKMHGLSSIEIKIEAEGHETLYLSLRDEYIYLADLAPHFPDISGLLYMKNGKKFTVHKFDNDRFLLEPLVYNYIAHIPSNVPKKRSVLSNPQQLKYDEIITKLKQRGNEDEEIEAKNSKKIGNPKISAKPKMKSISVSWKHRDSEKLPFAKQGTDRPLFLDFKKKYGVHDVEQRVIELYLSRLTKAYFLDENVNVCIGDKHNKPYGSFVVDGEEDFWRYVLPTAGGHKVHVNLLTTDVSDKTNSSSPSAKRNLHVKEQKILKQQNGDQSEPTKTITSVNNEKNSPPKRAEKQQTIEEENVKSSVVDHLPICSSLANNFKQPLPPTKLNPDLNNLNKGLGLPYITYIPEKNIQITNTLLGTGSFGTVVLAMLNKYTEVAAKRFEVYKTSLPEDILKEIIILRECTHENVVRMMGIHAYPGVFYIIFERIKGHNLREVIYNPSVKKSYNLDVNLKNHLATQVTLGISYIHGHHCGIIHRDIKPSNILVQEQFKIIKICDLGVGKINELSSRLCTTKRMPRILGTVLYMAPEMIIDGREATKAADMWSLGSTLSELYEEKHMWADTMESFQTLMSKKISPVVTDVPVFIKKLIEDCFDYEPSKRPTSDEMYEAYKNLNEDFNI